MCDYNIISCNIKTGSKEHCTFTEIIKSGKEDGCIQLNSFEYTGIVSWCTTLHQVNLVFNPAINNNSLYNIFVSK